MADTFVQIAHPEVDGEATVALSAVPGHAARGWLVTGTADSASGGASPAAAPQLARPAANASADAWRTYAVAAHVLGQADGLTFDEAMAATRDELVAHFAPLPDLNPDDDNQES